MYFTAWLVSSEISLISESICSAAFFDSSARFLTSEATTAKPRPCSPALAASMAAFNARRLVWSAIEVITSTILLILLDLIPSPSTAAADSPSLAFTTSSFARASLAISLPPLAISSVFSEKSLTSPTVLSISSVVCESLINSLDMDSTSCAWSLAPFAMNCVLDDICSVVALSSSLEAASSCAVDPKVSAASLIFIIIFLISSFIFVNVLARSPISSLLVISISCERSPLAIIFA